MQHKLTPLPQSDDLPHSEETVALDNWRQVHEQCLALHSQQQTLQQQDVLAAQSLQKAQAQFDTALQASVLAVTINAADKDLNVTFGGHDITAESTADKKFLEGVKVSGDKNVVINATGSTITAQGEGTYVRTAMVR